MEEGKLSVKMALYWYVMDNFTSGYTDHVWENRPLCYDFRF